MASPVPPAPASTAPSPTVKTKADVCSLISGADLQNIQGEQPKETQRSDREDAGFIVSQCYYSLPTTTNSVVLNLTTPAGGAGARDPREYWEETFARKAETNGPERKREGKAKEEGEGDGEEGAARPQKIAGLGEDAYWIAKRGRWRALRAKERFILSDQRRRPRRCKCETEKVESPGATCAEANLSRTAHRL